MAKKKIQLYTVKITNVSTGETQVINNLTLRGLFRLVKVNKNELLTILKN